MNIFTLPHKKQKAKQKRENIIQLHKSSPLKTPEKISLIPAGFYNFTTFAQTLIKFFKQIIVKILILLLLLQLRYIS